MPGKKYENVQVLFNKDNELDMKLLKYLQEQSAVIRESQYLKQLLYLDMKQREGQK